MLNFEIVVFYLYYYNKPYRHRQHFLNFGPKHRGTFLFVMYDRISHYMMLFRRKTFYFLQLHTKIHTSNSQLFANSCSRLSILTRKYLLSTNSVIILHRFVTMMYYNFIILTSYEGLQ